MSRDNAISRAEAYFDDGRYFADLSRRVALATESQNESRAADIRAYLTDEMTPSLKEMGFNCHLLDNPILERLPMLAAERIEDPSLPTVLTYGHGDVVRGMDEAWSPGLSPWRLVRDGDRWYGRGVVDNKGQHTLNLGALAAVLRERGRLGFNFKVLIDMGEEMGSPGLRDVCRREKKRLAADVLIGSDGPRLKADRPLLFGGTRGCLNFDLTVDCREGGHHSGNWGGLLANPGVILAHAIASLVDGRGRILVPELRPDGIPESVRRVLAEIDQLGVDGPEQDPDWGEPDQSQAEKVFGWNAMEVLAFATGDPEHPVHAIPPRAFARCQVRFVVGRDPDEFAPAVRRHLKRHGFDRVQVRLSEEDASVKTEEPVCQATRLLPDHPWARWAVASFERTGGRKPMFLPNVGGSLPNDVFTDIIGLPTIWIPHSYPGCSQHAPDEHLRASIYREAIGLMAGLFWDLGQEGRPS